MSTIQDEQERRMGRPALSADERKSATLRFRVRESLKDQLEQAAVQSGLSMSEEFERRIADSFKFDLILRVMLDSSRGQDLFVNLGTVLETVREYSKETGTLSDKSVWAEHDPTRAGLRAAIAVLVEHLIPPAREPNPAPATAAEARQERLYAVELENMVEFGDEFARMVIGQLSGPAEDLNTGGASEH
ncbi:hypothetical protein [Methylobacterium pseudosasicola]|uniref:Arc-like DNA binding domain-containing protein n=1 Tax=Methylobacterium pseudosasicola TaxID=582667 RepID=A0A1I4UST9_9HYPH|nr:hypothetical protein [Methylobacterium pseudosasicola]SFM92011.1 hypothetical protein SAMN05192568_107612 [Methylobacterium pseudosasicola]